MQIPLKITSLNNSYSIVIPIYKEKDNILKLIKLIKNNFKVKNYEIIFVDDNSKDGSLKILRKIKSNKIHFFIRFKKNDLTKSCILGIKKSRYNNIIIMDGDLQHHPKYLNKLCNLLIVKNNDIVVCSRTFKKRQNLSILRFYTSKILILIINIFLGYKVSDPMSGYFIFKKKIFIKNNKNFYGKGYKILFDFLYNSKNLKLDEIKINFYKRENHKSKMSLNILLHLFKSIIFKIFKKII